VREEAQPLLRLIGGGSPGAGSLARLYHPSSDLGQKPALYIGDAPGAGALVRHLAPHRETLAFRVVKEGRAGRQMAIDEEPSVIVMEDRLPDVDAAALVTELRREIVPARVPIVVLAGVATADDRARFLWAGANAYVDEPLDSMLICRTVGMVFDLGSWR
jgi:DNA-binding response OmpR family regulator